jgi:hypothetical protein
MAETTQGHIAGDVAGKALAADAQAKIEAVLKTTLEAELAKDRPKLGAVSHGSVTHGSVTKAF